ncbi:MAG: ribonuclease P protein component [Phycisphaerales bacterium]|nr:ribonuclease P protein component [Phycisphaerales bacterium]
MSGDLRFNRRMRINRDADFRRIFARRCSAATDALVVYVDASPEDGPRLGIRAGKRLGNAVTRNRARRRLKEAFRRKQHDLPALDFVCVIRRPGVTVADYETQLLTLATTAKRKLQRATKTSSPNPSPHRGEAG